MNQLTRDFRRCRHNVTNTVRFPVAAMINNMEYASTDMRLSSLNERDDGISWVSGRPEHNLMPDVVL